jgi:hypothetical protein
MKKLLPLSLVLFLLVLASCDTDEVDVTPPSVTIVNFDPSPESAEVCGSIEDEVFLVTGGQTLNMELLVEDEGGLSQYKIDIHNNFDCHGHGGGSTPSFNAPNGAESQTEDWTILEIEDLEGTSATINESLEVPANVAAGNYHLLFQVIDASGNDEPLANLYSVKVFNPQDADVPVISVDSPMASSFSAEKGSTVSFTGTVTDNRDLTAGGNGLVFLTYTDLSSGNTFTTDAFEVFEVPGALEHNFSLDFEIPQTIVSGDYEVTIRAHDAVRNVAEPVVFQVAVE